MKEIEIIEEALDMHHLTEIVYREPYDLEDGDGLIRIAARGLLLTRQPNAATSRVMFDILPVRPVGGWNPARTENVGCPCQDLAYARECETHPAI